MRQTARAIVWGVLTAAMTVALMAAPRGTEQRDVERIYRNLLGRSHGPGDPHLEARGGDGPPELVRLHNRLLDSTEFAARVDDTTFLVGLFRQLHRRAPLWHEIVIGRHFLDDGVARSDLADLVIQAVHGSHDVRGTQVPDASFFSRSQSLSYTGRRLRAYRRAARAIDREAEATLVRRLTEEAAMLRPVPTAVSPAAGPSGGPDPVYDVYYGYLHAHTRISLDAQLQGSAGPNRAFRHARDVAGLDFLGLSDHAEFISTWPWNNEWDKLGRAVERYNEDGRFVALRGFEY